MYIATEIAICMERKMKIITSIGDMPSLRNMLAF
jgi:hypothetical protein